MASFHNRCKDTLSILNAQDKAIKEFLDLFDRCNTYLDLIKRKKMAAVEDVNSFTYDLSHCATDPTKLSSKKMEYNELRSHINILNEDLKNHLLPDVKSIRDAEHVLCNVLRLRVVDLNAVLKNLKQKFHSKKDMQFYEDCDCLLNVLNSISVAFDKESCEVNDYEYKAIVRALKSTFYFKDLFMILTYAGHVDTESIGFHTLQELIGIYEAKYPETAKKLKNIVDMVMSKYSFFEKLHWNLDSFREHLRSDIQNFKTKKEKEVYLEKELSKFAKFQVGYKFLKFAKAIAGPSGLPIISNIGSVLEVKQNAEKISLSFMDLLMETYDSLADKPSEKASKYDSLAA